MTLQIAHNSNVNNLVAKAKRIHENPYCTGRIDCAQEERLFEQLDSEYAEFQAARFRAARWLTKIILTNTCSLYIERYQHPEDR